MNKRSILKIYKLKVYLIAGLIAAAIAIGIFLAIRLGRQSKDEITIEQGRTVDLRPIAELCGMEIYRETVVADTINDKAIYGIQKQQGRITFDIEQLPSEVAAATRATDSIAGDTLRLRLPKEKIELLESTEKDSWRVIDTKSLKFFGSDRMTPQEENVVKRRAIERARKKLYQDGTVNKARREAAATLRDLASQITGRPVIVEQ